MTSRRDAIRLLTIGAGVLAVVWAVHLYVDYINARVAVGEPGQDFGVFLRAAGDVLHGRSPYSFDADQTYAYPPLVALLVAPLHALSVGWSMSAWMVLSFSAVAGALWLLGVRDWRCYPLVLLYPVTRSAVDLGTVGPLLLLTCAVAWRWRDRLVPAAGAVGVAVALKLFLWPLALWLAVTGRLRTAVAAVSAMLVVVLASWAVIGFAGLGDYPHLLRRLADAEASSSYSMYAVGLRLHLPRAAAVVFALAIAAALLVLAARAARDVRRSPDGRDAVSLTYALAAALAASPIVWMHYFLLLLVPLALARPRLSVLWLVPFAYSPLGETAWPAGDARKLGLALVTSAVLVVAAVRQERPEYEERADARTPAPPRLEGAEAMGAHRVA